MELKHYFNISKRVRVCDGYEIDVLRNATLGNTFNGGVVTPLSNDLYFNKDPEKSFTFKFLEQPLAVLPVVNYFRKDSHLVKEFNKKLRAFKFSGLIDYWTNLYMKRKFARTKDESGPKPLTVETIIGTFQLLIFGWIVGTFTFIGEHVYFAYKRFHIKRQ